MKHVRLKKGKLELTTFKNGTAIGRITLEPGWSWDKCVKPIVKTNSCEAPHTQYMISGRIRVAMDDGSEDEFGPGDTAIIPPSHNAWVVGNEPVVGIDFTGLKDLGNFDMMINGWTTASSINHRKSPARNLAQLIESKYGKIIDIPKILAI
jgi:quercetin dioxygenase-like cupin family protein